MIFRHFGYGSSKISVGELIEQLISVRLKIFVVNNFYKKNPGNSEAFLNL